MLQIICNWSIYSDFTKEVRCCETSIYILYVRQMASEPTVLPFPLKFTMFDRYLVQIEGLNFKRFNPSMWITLMPIATSFSDESTEYSVIGWYWAQCLSPKDADGAMSIKFISIVLSSERISYVEDLVKVYVAVLQVSMWAAGYETFIMNQSMYIHTFSNRGSFLNCTTHFFYPNNISQWIYNWLKTINITLISDRDLRFEFIFGQHEDKTYK